MGGVIVQQETDKRQQALEQALLAQREFIWKSRALILRQGVLKSGLVVGEQNQGKNQPVQKMDRKMRKNLNYEGKWGHAFFFLNF